ncbi:MAG TPA: RT0821/Lpp0805 family surface protein [Aliidongia sp.]|nr:RT0821/Lpp0805 family surface protein [Aliidongia sp.]
MSRLNLILCAGAMAIALGPSTMAGAAPAEQESHFIAGHPTRSDFAMMKDIGLRLYRRDDAVKGASEAWQNSQSGHHGTISVLDIFERSGVPCRKVRYQTVFDVTTSTDYVLNWCRTTEGEWKVS